MYWEKNNERKSHKIHAKYDHPDLQLNVWCLFKWEWNYNC